MKKLLATAMGFLAGLGLSLAQSTTDLQASFDQGNYAEVYEQAMALGTAEGYALAARAGTNYALYKAANMEEQTKWFDQAIAAAEQALEADSENALANFAWGEAQGRKAIVMMEQQGIGGMLRNPSIVGLIRPMRERAEKAIELNPNLNDAYVLLGLWHVALRSNIVPFGFGRIYGANTDKGVEALQKAVELCSAGCARLVTANKEYGFGLWVKGDKEEAKAQLEKTLTLTPKTEEDRQELARARVLLDGLNQGKKPLDVKQYKAGVVQVAR